MTGPTLVYVLCMITSALCAALLYVIPGPGR